VVFFLHCLFRMISKTFSSCLDGFEGQLVVLEASKQNSLPQIHITGLPGTVVQESRERVKASLNHLGFDTPSKKILIHLSPAETKKTGSHFDFAIAMNVLSADGFFPPKKIEKCAFLGELTLSGELRPVSHFIPLLEALIKHPMIEKILVPFDNQLESGLFRSDKVFHCRDLKEAIRFCFYDEPILSVPQANQHHPPKNQPLFPLIEQVVGQEYAKRVLTIALAGCHPLLLEGPPGSGKTLLSHSAASLLPGLSDEELVEVSRVYSFFGEQREGNRIAPFRSPHHSISSAAFLGGGSSQVMPGELSLAHRGLLFLDELPEFRRDAIEGLREPLQSGEIHLHRVSKSILLPARFSLIAAMNPCPCGYSNSNHERCSCSSEAIRSYRKKISGPILDRFPLYLWMETSWNQRQESTNSSHETRKLIEATRKKIRELGLSGGGWLRLKAHLDLASSQLLSKWETKSRASFRRIENILRVSLTTALLDKRDIISKTDLEEAWALRSPESLI